MDWIDEVRSKIKRKNQILFSKDSEFLKDLVELFDAQNHRVLALWAFEMADETVQKLLERYPDEKRPGEAVSIVKDWAAGKVKMPEAQSVILQVHAAAKEISSPEDIALLHAVGQACGVVHTKGHAIGFPVYDLTAIIRHHGIDECRAPVEKRKKEYIDRINYWNENYENFSGKWADFLSTDD